MALDPDVTLDQLRRVSRARRERTERPRHHAPLLVAAGILLFSVTLQSLRDSFLVPLLTGNFGDQMVMDSFWTPLINWTSLLMFVGALVAGMGAWYRAQPGAGDAQTELPIPVAWIALFLGSMILLGGAVGVGAALFR